jgi:hypothetical protein
MMHAMAAGEAQIEGMFLCNALKIEQTTYRAGLCLWTAREQMEGERRRLG